MLATPEKLFLYRHVNGQKRAGKIELGTEPNFTLYWSRASVEAPEF